MNRALRQQLRRHWRRSRFLAQHRPLAAPPASIQLTCAGKRDGGGAQWHAVLSVLALARSYGIPFCHHPLQSIEHGPSHDPAWLQTWNGLFDLESCGIPLCLPDAPRLICTDPLQVLSGRRHGRLQAGSVLQLDHAHAFSNLFPERLAALQPLLRQAYRPRPQLTPPPLPLHHTLVVHVRRGDVQAVGPHQHRFTSAAAISDTCRSLQARHPQLRQVLLLSASADADLMALCGEECRLDAKHDVFTHLHWMSQAAGLVMARSSLSYLAAMLNPNLVFYERFEHPPLPGWIRLRRSAANVKR